MVRTGRARRAGHVAVRLPDGATAAGTNCGIKRRSPDLGVLVFDAPVSWAGTFTRNAAAAPCVLWSRSRLGSLVRGIVVNSGNANACTGAAGTKAVAATVKAAASSIGCHPDEVLASSTGPIGIPLPTNEITSSLPALVTDLSTDVLPFAHAILTTDTTTKLASSRAAGASIVGVAKGAAMLAPNMATMLAFIVTDAAIDPTELQSSIQEAVDASFNRLSVDACESTNDSVYLFTTGKRAADASDFSDALRTVTRDLAEQIVRDAEGGTRVVRIDVSGARDESHAVELGRAIAASALWKAAVHGGDPNWGRVLAAMGSVDRQLDTKMVRIDIGESTVFDAGEPATTFELAAMEMTGKDVHLRCHVGPGPGAAEILTTDLSPEYVELNAGGIT
jgi:glutamate N-acetyltransferase / amino-acid N-acetyltransferase